MPEATPESAIVTTQADSSPSNNNHSLSVSEQALSEVTPVVTEIKLPSPELPTPFSVAASAAPSGPERSDVTQRQAPRAHLSPRANTRATFGQQVSQYNRQSTSSLSSPGERKSQPFARSPLAGNDSFSSWATLAPGTNVWGSSGIGNGTFETSNSFAPLQQSTGLPLPPGMNRISPQSFNPESHSPSLQHQQLADQQRTFAPPPGIETRQERSWNPSRVNGGSTASGFGRRDNLPAPIGPPSRAHQHQAPMSNQADKWQQAAQYLPAQYHNDAAAAAAVQKEKVSTQSPPPSGAIKETFKQTAAGSRLGGPRRYANPEYTIHDVEGSRQVPSLSPAPPSAQTQPSGPFSAASPLHGSWKQPNENTVRIPDGSLNPAHGGLPVQQPPIAPPTVHKSMVPVSQGANFPTAPLAPILEFGDQSPPPPEVSSYPILNSITDRPAVRLPPPPPVVKLPPTMTSMSTQQSSATMPHNARAQPNWGPTGASRPIVMNAAWQARFNGLFNRTSIHTEVPPSPPRTPPKSQDPVLAVASSSKAQLDDSTHRAYATVSLPWKRASIATDGFVIDASSYVVSKPAIDDIFSEELSFGSLPKVQVPRNPVYSGAVRSHKSQHNMLKFQSNSKLHKAIEVHSKPELDVMDILFKHHAGYFLKIPRTRLNNRLIKHLPGDRAPPSVHKERKVSRKVSKGKDPKDAAIDASTANTQAAETKGTAKRIDRVATPSSPAAVTGKASREHGKKRSTWAAQKGQARNPAAAVVKS